MKNKKKMKREIRKKVKCPVCGTNDFDVDKNWENGYCIVGCGAWFKINKDGTTEKVGGIHTEVCHNESD